MKRECELPEDLNEPCALMDLGASPLMVALRSSTATGLFPFQPSPEIERFLESRRLYKESVREANFGI